MKRRVLCNSLQEPEGPVCLPDGHIYVAEMSSSRHCISRIDPTGQYQRVGDPGWRPNGLAIDGSDSLWVAGGGRERLVRMGLDGALLDIYGGPKSKPFLWPNDLAFAENGLLYMTDSGIDPGEFVQGQAIRADFRNCRYDGRVYEIDPRSGDVLRQLDSGLRFPNGIAIDLHGRLYVGETISGNIYRYDLASLATPKREVFSNVVFGAPEGFVGPDGMAFGSDGRLYCAVFGQGDVTVLDSDGKVVERIPTCGKRPTNIAFCEDPRGGAVVTILDVGCLEWLGLPCAGRQLYRPKI
ncbi:NHL repeat-containing protein [Microbulbifer sp. VAAF005]|uniref:SMP-30/gluconolactonase/LRE family protein n=1 Tax=Microbulbifer sp. VAAF005 TaxID=3034230 RepID=UPI0024AE0837|nr:NHL repeat-containing protein [Microbulbifer sp. VAAF005]WHI47284.1 NHL repeat-containing protein [Microbulbifer sp. VAAF005]